MAPDIIESWTPTETLEEMPKANLCSYCFTTKLAVMQQNPYGAYGSGGYRDTYDAVVKSMRFYYGFFENKD